MAEDARYRTIVYITAYINTSNITKDDDATIANICLMYSKPDYPLIAELRDAGQLGGGIEESDLTILVGTPTSKPRTGHDYSIIGYEEAVPIYVHAIDKYGITAEELLWKAEAELRRVVETNPLGSVRTHVTTAVNNIVLPDALLKGFTFTMNYMRDKT